MSNSFNTFFTITTFVDGNNSCLLYFNISPVNFKNITIKLAYDKLHADTVLEHLHFGNKRTHLRCSLQH